MTKPTKKNVLLAVIAVLVIIQFFQIDKSPIPVDTSQDYLAITVPPAEVGQMIKGACYDCHSNEIVWPWYTHIQPLGWWIRGHTRGGRQHLNFSEWGGYGESKQAHKLEECIEQMEEDLMPLKSYRWLHSDGQLTDADRNRLAKWFKEGK